MRILFINKADTRSDIIRQFFKCNFKNCEYDIYSKEKFLILENRPNPFSYDVVFFDIDQRNGFILKDLKICMNLWDKNGKLLFIFIISADMINPLLYKIPHIYVMRKPLDGVKLKKAMERINLICKNLDFYDDSYNLKLNWNSKTFFLKERYIIYVSRIKHGTKIITTQDTFMHSERFEDFIEKLELPTFCRCAYSTVVNFRFVQKVENNYIFMNNGETISITRSYQKNVKNFLNRIL